MQQETDTAAELELAMLQINQLQEELEHYYMQNIKLQDQICNNSTPTAVSMKLLRNVRLSDSAHKNSAENDYNQRLLQQLENLKRSCQLTEEKVAEIVGQNAGLAAEVDNKNQQIDTLNSTNKSLVADNEKQQKQYDEFESSHRQAVSEKGSLVVRIAELGSENDSLLLQIGQLQEELETEHTGKSSEISRLTATLEQLTTAKSALEASKQSSEQNNSQHQLEIAEFENRNTRLELEVSENLDQISELTATIEQLTSESSALEVTVAQLQSKQQKLEGTLSHKDGQITAITKQRDEQTHWHQENKNWAENLQKQIEFEQNKLNALASEKQNLQKEHADSVKALNEKLDNRIRHADLNQKMLAKAQIDLEQLRNKYKEKAASEMSLVNLVKELRDKLSLASEYYYRIQNQYPELVLDLSERTGQN